MQLKEYQNGVLEDLSRYLRTLTEKRQEAEEVVTFLKSKGREAKPEDYCRKTWETLIAEHRIPTFRDRLGHAVTPPYVARNDGLDRPIPNVCFKVPTGGGKTLLAAAAMERLNVEYFKKQTGFVLWVVPSDAIYRQTWKALANREHPYRQMLERASGGRVKLLEREDTFTRTDVADQLCVMLIMLQAGAVKKESKEKRRMFQDSGRFTSFFPDVDDLLANKELLRQVGNLDVCETTDPEFRAAGLTVKQSLGNVLRLVRPVIVIDEGHKAYSDTALRTLAEFNPRFILELTATPNADELVSNVLVNVTGLALKAEQMVKLPINLINIGRADWKHTLAEATEQLDKLKQESKKLQSNEGRYVRPIMLIRVERTGADQRDSNFLHSETVREYLIQKLGVHPDQIKVKSADLDELGDEDLFAETCKVRFIITKDALREGWDCSFAYVLAILSRTTARTALTQMVGRVMRQPHAQTTGRTALNECYVFTYDQEVQDAVESVRRGLQEEGMGDLAESVRAGTQGSAGTLRREIVKRREQFRGKKIFLPRVLSRHLETDEWRLFDYDRDLLRRLDWDKFSFAQQFTPDGKEGYERTVSRVSVEDLGRVDDTELPRQITTEEPETDLDFAALVRLLLDVIPNPWQAARILEETLADLRKRNVDEKRLATNRLFLVKAMRDDLRRQVNDAGEKVFRAMLEKAELSFRLEASENETLNWKLAETLELDVTDEDRRLYRENGDPLDRTLFEVVYRKQFNGLEKDVAWHLDGAKAIRWWHRIAAGQGQDYHLQGWQRNRVYPDFLACIENEGNGKFRFTVLETKGLHLKGSEDTEYKRRLLELLTEHSKTALSAGELKLNLEHCQIRFELLLEDNWRDKLARETAQG